MSLEAERSVLGAVLIDNKVMDEVGHLEPEDFVHSAIHQLLWEGFKHDYEKGEPIDLLIVTTKLQKHGRLEDIGGTSYLYQLMDIPTIANADYYAKLVKSSSLRHRMKQLSRSLMELATDEKMEDAVLIGEAEKMFEKINRATSKPMLKTLKELKGTFFDKLQTLTPGIPTGFERFDTWSGGLGRGWLRILAGRPSVGKTAKALQEAFHMAGTGQGAVLIFSQEMLADQLLMRVMANKANVHFGRIRKRTIDQFETDRIATKYGEMTSLPVLISEKTSIRMSEVISEARKYKRKHGKIAAIIIDYLTIMDIPQEKGETRSQAVGETTRRAKQAALELDCVFTVLAQLSRAGAGVRPQPHHLRDSGEIEQDADVIEFLWRETEEELPDGSMMVTSTIAKGRDIGIDEFEYKFVGKFQRYEEV